MKYLIVILLPDDIAKNIDIIQHKYNNGRWSISLPPHITLVPPMNVDKSADKIAEIIESLIKNIQPFNIELKDIGYFAHKHYVIYQSVKITPELSKLANDLINAFEKIAKEMKKYDKFTAHVTLSNDLKEEEFKESFTLVKKEITKRTFICNQIALMSREPDQDKWKIEKVFDL